MTRGSRLRRATAALVCMAAAALDAGGLTAAAADLPGDMVRIQAGTYTPLFRDAGETQRLHVDAFLLDRHLVSNAAFAAFLSDHPEWAPGRIKPVFADAQYLGHWGGTSPAADIAGQPVTQVSWFAARAYCKALGKRLPTVDEWEYAAAANEAGPDGTDDPGFRRRVLEWYSRPAITRLPDATDTWQNYWGVKGMHGVVWELVSDFNSALISGESRGDTTLETSLYCGAGSAASADPADYAAFMRYALRSSYEATSTLRSLGFRCARDAAPAAEEA